MIGKLILLALMIMPALTRAQIPEKCSDVVALPKELYDSFQLVKTNVDGEDNEITKYSESRNELLKQYLGCETQSDVAFMLNQVSESLQKAENTRKTWEGPSTRIEAKIRQFISQNLSKQVEYRRYDPYGGGKLGIVTTTLFKLQGDALVTSVSTVQLTEPILSK
jgi:hypothetical protein